MVVLIGDFSFIDYCSGRAEFKPIARSISGLFYFYRFLIHPLFFLILISSFFLLRQKKAVILQ